MDFLNQSFTVHFSYNVYFTEKLFHLSNPVFSDFLQSHQTKNVKKLLFVVDEEVIKHHAGLEMRIRDYTSAIDGYMLSNILVVPGGEKCKNEEHLFYNIINAINDGGIDRHSYLIVVGGGSLLDLSGYAAAVAHRGIRHIRVPTTVLSQNDSGVGVKNGINYLSKKNFLGTFAPPVAVFNDYFFLTSLTERDWRSGISEAIKVALIKDLTFFEWLEENAVLLASRDMAAMKYLVKKCAALHLLHIRSGDPFELGSSRPLDFGHWSAHKMEQLTNFELRHGEAVALGIALDSVYSFLSGRLKEEDAHRIITLLHKLGFATTHPLMIISDDASPVLIGLNEFQEHLGGELTIMLLVGLGKGEEVHELNVKILIRASEWLQKNGIIADYK